MLKFTTKSIYSARTEQVYDLEKLLSLSEINDFRIYAWIDDKELKVYVRSSGDEVVTDFLNRCKADGCNQYEIVFNY